MTWVVSILTLILNFGLKFFQSQKPPVEVTEAEKAGAAEQALSNIEVSDAKVEAAAKTANATIVDVSTTTGLSKYEASDPNNRDGK